MVTLLISSNFHVRIICTDIQSARSHPLTYVQEEKKGNRILNILQRKRTFLSC